MSYEAQVWHHLLLTDPHRIFGSRRTRIERLAGDYIPSLSVSFDLRNAKADYEEKDPTVSCIRDDWPD